MDKQQMEASPMHPALAHTRRTADTGLAIVIPLQPVPRSKKYRPSGYTSEQLRRIIDLNLEDDLPVELARDLVMNGPSS
jgi:hypothetical protein